MEKSEASGGIADHGYDVFISYKSEDLAHAEALDARLVAAGFRVWFDKARLDPGCDWHGEIEKGCDNARVVLPVLTPGWKTSAWTRFETYGAEAVIPLHYEGTWEEVATPPLIRWQAHGVDLRGPGEPNFERLIDKPAPEKGPRTAHLRYRANRYFVGREEELNQIHEALHRSPTTALTQGSAFAVAAMGGVGKTTLARQYAERFWRLYPEMYWVDCRAGLVSELARLATLLCPGLDTRDDNEKAAAALRALSDRTERLLILDNAEDEVSASAWIPKTGGCRTIITSRFTAWSAAIETCHIYVLNPNHARELLLKRAGREASDENQEAADLLAKKLGYLPLALEQAAAFVAEEGKGYRFGDYLKLYDQATHDLPATGALGSTEYPDSVRTTWAATVNRLSPMPRALLRLASYLSTEPIPMEMLVKGMSVIEERTAALASRAAAETPKSASPEFAVRSGIKALSAYSMVTPHGQGISVHGLVQTVQRLDVPKDERLDWIKGALALVDGYAKGDPTDVRTWPIWDAAGPHVAAAATHADNAGIADPTARLMNQHANLLFKKCQFSKAEPLYRRALAINEQSYGKDHPDVASDLNNLAQLLQATNRLAEAEPLYRRAVGILFDFTRATGHPHLHLVSFVTNYRYLLKAMGMEDAEARQQRIADLCQAHGMTYAG